MFDVLLLFLAREKIQLIFYINLIGTRKMKLV